MLYSVKGLVVLESVVVGIVISTGGAMMDCCTISMLC